MNNLWIRHKHDIKFFKDILRIYIAPPFRDRVSWQVYVECESDDIKIYCGKDESSALKVMSIISMALKNRESLVSIGHCVDCAECKGCD